MVQLEFLGEARCKDQRVGLPSPRKHFRQGLYNYACVAHPSLVRALVRVTSLGITNCLLGGLEVVPNKGAPVQGRVQRAQDEAGWGPVGTRRNI